MKKIYIITLLSFFFYSQNSFAFFADPMAKVESTLKQIETAKNKVLEVKKTVQDTATKGIQGFENLKNCFGNPLKCGGAIKGLSDSMSGISSIGGALKSGNLSEKPLDDMAESVITDGTYQKGQGKDIERKNEKNKENNAAVIDNVAKLFAKGMVTHQSIILEGEDVYKADFSNNNLDEIMYAQSKMSLNSKKRIAHILELRSFMHSADAIKELTQYNRESNEGE